MEIVLAESLGFCMGVKRAVDMAYRAIEKADGRRVVTLGPLIHNAQEIERLEKDGVEVVDEVAVPDDSTVIIRAHGVTPQAMLSLKSRG
jgi:4-hydroxy-3-methylbut-2-enyl diphosphate reductase IspH